MNDIDIFDRLKNRYPALGDVIQYIKENFKVGDKILSERNLELYVGHNRQPIREALLILECRGNLFRAHGKPTVYLREL